MMTLKILFHMDVKWGSRPFDPPAFATDFKSTSTLFLRTWDWFVGKLELEPWKLNSTRASRKFCSTEKPLLHYIVRQSWFPVLTSAVAFPARTSQPNVVPHFPRSFANS